MERLGNTKVVIEMKKSRGGNKLVASIILCYVCRMWLLFWKCIFHLGII